MGFFDKDSSAMLEVYLAETHQLIEQLNIILLNSEDSHCLSVEDIQNIFRIMHTMKSSSAMMGLEGLSTLTHKMEDIFSIYRDYQRNIEIEDKTLYNLLFDVFDFIEKELNAMMDDDYQPSSTNQLQNRADEYHHQLSTKQMKPSETVAFDIEDYLKSDGRLVKITFEKECRMENIRAFMLVHQIEKKCQKLETYPADLDDSSSAEMIQKYGFYLCINSDDFETVFKTLQNGLFVHKCEIVERKSKTNRKIDLQVATAQIQQKKLDILENISNEFMIHVQYLNEHLEEMGIEDFEDGVVYHLEQLSHQLEDIIIEMRLGSVQQIVPKLRRTLRDICQSQDKEADFIVNCGDIEADQKIVEYLGDALIHILRNAVDHGIETPQERIQAQKDTKGKITFDVSIKRGELYVALSDDGQGMDVKKIYQQALDKDLVDKPFEEYEQSELLKIILIPGFTTNKEVNEYSGRGVGLDVVAHILEEVGGHIYIESELGVGSTFILTLPLSLATVDSIRFQIGEYHCSVASRYVYYFQKANLNMVQEIEGKQYVVTEEQMIPFINLKEDYDINEQKKEDAIFVYFKTATHLGCLLVDHVDNNQRLLIKHLPVLLGNRYRNISGISGMSLLSKGEICLNLDLELLIEKWKEGDL